MYMKCSYPYYMKNREIFAKTICWIKPPNVVIIASYLSVVFGDQ